MDAVERYVDSGGSRLWTEATGVEHLSRGAVLLANGGPGCGDYLRPVADMLAGMRCVIRFEQRGCGRSAQDGRYGLDTAVADIEAIRAAYGVDAWTVGGHSWGANLALVYALEHPDRVDALLYIAGNGLAQDEAWEAAYEARRMTVGEAVPPLALAMNRAVNHAGNADLRHYARRQDLPGRLARLDVPALFLAAGADIRPQGPARRLCERMPGARWVPVPGAGHYPWLTHAARTAQALVDFIQPERT